MYKSDTAAANCTNFSAAGKWNTYGQSAISQSVNQNVNFFNIDMVYTWQFAPGSFINVVRKNSIFHSTNALERDYFKNLGNTLDADQNNNLSLKVICFLDYLAMKKWGKKK